MLKITSQRIDVGTPNEEAAAAARALLKELCIADPAEIVLEDIAMTRGVYVIAGGLFGAEARLVRGHGRGIVRVKDMPGELGRKRFAVAHEIGHWVLHDGVSQLSLCTTEDFISYSSSPVELAANAFAGELLMPTSLFRPLCKEPDLKLIRTLAERFNVSWTAASLRFTEECGQDCAVVFSKGGRVKWFRSSDSKRVFIKPGTEVSSNRVARACSTPDEMQPVNVDVWFPGWYRPGVIRIVQEQSVLLRRYETVMTLLWIEDQKL